MSWFDILKASTIDADWVMDIFHWEKVWGMRGLLSETAKFRDGHKKTNKIWDDIGREIVKHGYITFPDYGGNLGLMSVWNTRKGHDFATRNYGKPRFSGDSGKLNRPLNLTGHGRPMFFTLMKTNVFKSNIIPVIAPYNGKEYDNPERRSAATVIASKLNSLINEEVKALNKSLIPGLDVGYHNKNPGNSMLLERIRNASMSGSQIDSYFYSESKRIDEEAYEWYDEWKDKQKEWA